MEWLKMRREAHGLTQQELAKALGVSQQYISYIERGERKPSVSVAKRIAAVLGFDWTRFYDDEK